MYKNLTPGALKAYIKMSVETRLETLDAFKQAFTKDYASFLNAPFFAKLVESLCGGDGIVDLPNILLHGSDGMVLDLCLGIFLSALTRSLSPPVAREADAIHRFPHMWHTQYIVVDAAVLLSDDRAHLIEHLRHMTSHESMDPITKRHIIVIKNAHTLTQNVAFAMRKMIEDPNYTCLFVFTTLGITKMESAIISRCMVIRCCVNANKCHSSVIDRLGLQVPPPFLEACLQKSKGNISKFLAILERRDSRSGAGMFLFDNFVESRLRTLVAQCGNRNIFLKLVEDTASRLELSGVRPEAVCSALIDMCPKVQPDVDMTVVVSLLATIQMKMLASNKLTYVLEELLHSLVGVLTVIRL